jgi:hypothetical protein
MYNSVSTNKSKSLIQSTRLEAICYDPTSINTYLCVWSGHFQIARSMACLERGILTPKQ